MPKLFIILVQSPLAYSQTLLPPRHMFSKTSCLTILGVNPASCYNKGHRDEFSGFFFPFQLDYVGSVCSLHCQPSRHPAPTA